MAKKKSLGQIIGEIIAAIRLGKQLSIEQELQAAESWDKVTAENRQNTINFITKQTNFINQHNYNKKIIHYRLRLGPK